MDATAGREAKYRTEASGLLSGTEKFECIITLLTVYQYLSHMAGITVKLQSTSIDIIQAFNMVEEVKNVYKNLWETIATDFAKIYDHAVKMAATIDVESAKPRTASRMQNRANAPAEAYTPNAVVELLPHRHCVGANSDCAVTSPGGAFQTYTKERTLPIRIWPITDAVLSCSLTDSDVVDHGVD